MKSQILKLALWFILVSAAILLFTGQVVQRKVQGKGGSLFLTRPDSLFLAGKLDEARLALDAVLDTIPDDPVFLYNRALLERRMNEGDGIARLEKAFEERPDSEYILHLLGAALTDSGELKRAESLLRRALKKGKGDYRAGPDLGRNLRLQGKLKEARNILERSLHEGRFFARSCVELAEVHLQAGSPELAREVLLNGREKFPYEEILSRLISLTAENGTADSLRTLADEYLSLYPRGPHLAQVQSALNQNGFGGQLPEEMEIGSSSVADVRESGLPDSLLPLNKRLTYKVKYGFIRLGTLELELLDDDSSRQPYRRAQFSARSATGLPFVSIVDTFRVYISRDLRWTRLLEMHYHEKDYSSVEVYDFDHRDATFHDREVVAGGFWEMGSHPLPSEMFDLSSLIWFAERLAVNRHSGTGFTSISGGFEKTPVNFVGEGKTFKLAGRSWNSVVMDGKLSYAGLAGLTGEYTGWFDAEKGWPLMAKFKIFFGSIRILLESETDVINSSNWQWPAVAEMPAE